MLREEAWQELKETITELRDNDGTGTQQEVCKFLANYMDNLEKQITDKWIPVSEKPPKDGKYCVTRRTYEKPVVDTVSYAKDLYTINKFDFANKKGKSGWYGYDSDFGYCEVTESIIAWQELPEPYKVESESDK